MTDLDVPPTSEHADAAARSPWRIGTEVLAVGLALLLVTRFLTGGLGFTDDALRTWGTLFVALNVQALPFLVLGVTVSGAIAAWLPPEVMVRILPKNGPAAVVCASGAGVLLPGCECGSVPISGRLVARGVQPAAALAFMLAAPAINPVVLVSTWVAFPGQPEMVVARFVASVATAVGIGWLWLRKGATDALVERAKARVQDRESPLATFVATATHDLLHAGGYLVIGAAIAATIQVVVPRDIVDTVAGNPVLAVLAMATLAILLSICSEADAFVAASLTQFSLTSRLVFLVVGPAVDLKLIALQTGFFGRDFAVRFAPATTVVAILAALTVGGVLL